MKYIYYLSSSNVDLFPNNSSTEFTSQIQPQFLDSLPEGELEAAVKTISFDNRRKPGTLLWSERLVLKSNLSSKILSSGTWDNIIAWFSLGKQSLRKKNLTFEFNNPSFFLTTRDLLSKASFELANIYNNTKPSIINNSQTFIQIIVRQPQKRMKHPFYIHLDSACSISKSFFPGNTSTNFSIQLPNRLEFSKDWIIALKNLSLQNRFYNVFDCFIILGTKTYKLEDGIDLNEEEILKRLNQLMGGILQFRAIPLNASSQGGKVFVRAVRNIDEEIIFSKNLSQILGLSDQQLQTSLNYGEHISSTSKVNAKAIVPRQIVISCDVIENSLLAGEKKQILRIVTLPENNGDSFFNFEFSTNEYLKLECKSFDRIKIKISDLNGNPIKMGGNLSTRLQILFLNINSSQ